MENILIYAGLFILGAAFGSFAGAQVWRLRAAQLKGDAKAGEKISAHDKKQVKHLEHRKGVREDRSRCLHCGHSLAWYDLLPVISWLQLGGRCRYCREPIGRLEIAIELGLGLFFVGSYLFWPYGFDTFYDTARFVLWLVASVGLAILFVYDSKWFLLPDKVTFPLIGVAALSSALFLAQEGFTAQAFISVVTSCALLSGLYFALYYVSKGAWIGFGDIKLGLVLALLLADWQLAVLALFLANFIGTLIVFPLLSLKKITRETHLPFGPLLIAGWAIAGLFGGNIIAWYLALSLGQI